VKEKIILHGLVFILFLFFAQRTIVNIIDCTKNNLEKGIIYNITSYKRSINSATTYTYFIIDEKGIKYEDGGDSDTKESGFLIGDTITFRKLHNSNLNSVRMIKRNGEQVRNYYGFVDYASLIGLIIIILCYIFIPKLLKK